MPRASERYANLAALARLIGLGSTHGDDGTLAHEFHGIDIDGHELGASETTRKSNQQQSAVAGVFEPVSDRV